MNPDVDDDLPPTLSPLDELASLFAPLGPWAKQAACAARGVDPTIFDAPESDDLTSPVAVRAGRQRQALSLCRSCPVQQECRADAETNDLTGIRGGVLYAGMPGRRVQYDLGAYADAGLLNRPLGFGRAPRLPDASHAA